MDGESDMWSNLAYDLLVTISEALTIPDIFAFASVCRSWRCAAGLKDKNRHLHRFKLQKPWLAFSGGSETNTFANFHSISDGKFYAIGHQPALASLNTCMLIGSDHGWIIAADERSELLLVNPMTRKQIALPPVSTLDTVIPRLDESGDNIISYGVEETEYDRELQVTGEVCEYTVENLRYSMYWKACLSSPPSSSGGGYTVVVLLHSLGSLAFARSGDDRWTMVNDVLNPLFIVDMVFRHRCHNDNGDDEVVLHTTNESGKIEEWDLTSSNRAVMKKEEILPVQVDLVQEGLDGSDWDDYFFYLVPTAWGDLLHVRRVRGEKEVRDYVTCRIQVYKVDFGGRTLVKVESLGHHAIFLGGSSPVCVSTEDAPALKPNRVYFTDKYSEFSRHEREGRRDIGIYSLEDGSVEPILPDDTRLYWPPPLWFTHSLLS